MMFFSTLGKVCGVLWDTANFWGRIAVIFFVSWMVGITIFAGSGADWSVIYGIGIVPVGFGILFFAAIPAGFAALWLTLPVFQRVAGILRFPGIVPSFGEMVWPVLYLLMVELLWTAYCMMVPVENSPELLAGVVLAIIVSGIPSRGPSRFAENVRLGANFAVVAMTVLFWFAGDPAKQEKDPEPGSAAYALHRAKSWWEGYVEEARESSKPKDRIDLYPDTFGYEVPFEAGMTTKVIRANAYEREGSGWKVVYDIDATDFCRVEFLDGATFAEGPGLKVNYGIRPGAFRIVGIGSGVARVSVWRDPVMN